MNDTRKAWWLWCSPKQDSFIDSLHSKGPKNIEEEETERTWEPEDGEVFCKCYLLDRTWWLSYSWTQKGCGFLHKIPADRIPAQMGWMTSLTPYWGAAGSTSCWEGKAFFIKIVPAGRIPMLQWIALHLCIDRSFCPTRYCSHSVPKKHTETYINYKCFGLLAQAYY